MKLRKLTRENCINFIDATKTSSRHTYTEHWQPYFYREADIMIFDPYFDPYFGPFPSGSDVLILNRF